MVLKTISIHEPEIFVVDQFPTPPFDALAVLISNYVFLVSESIKTNGNFHVSISALVGIRDTITVGVRRYLGVQGDLYVPWYSDWEIR
jgi:hypothetical protein